MKRFTINDIRKWKPCYDPNRYLTKSWKGTVLDILNDDSIPFENRLWVIMRPDLVSERLMRRFSVCCGRQVQYLMLDQRSLHALDVAEAYAENRWAIDDAEYAKAWEDERAAARIAACDAAETARSIALVAAWKEALDPAIASAEVAAQVAAWSVSGNPELAAAEVAAQVAAWSVSGNPELAAKVAAEKAAEATARNAVGDAVEQAKAEAIARVAQECKLREMLIAGIETGDTK